MTLGAARCKTFPRRNLALPKGESMNAEKVKQKRKSVRRLRSFEEKEHMFTLFAWFYYDPFRGPLRLFAEKVGVSLLTLQSWRKDPLFEKIAATIREERRKKIGPIIDRKLFKRAAEGSFPHMNLYYQLCGDLVNKTEIAHKPTDIPKDPIDIQIEIDKLTAEVGALPKGKSK